VIITKAETVSRWFEIADDALIALPDAERGHVLGYGDAIVFLAEKPATPRRRCLQGGSPE
jgi:hypothetical protein